MNTLSFLIYLIDVVGNVQNVMTAGAIISGIAVVLLSLVYAVQSRHERDEHPVLGYRKGFAILFLVCTPIAVLMPSKQAMVMVAASQIGEKVLMMPKTSEIMEPTVDIFKDWIKLQSKELKKKLQE